MAVAAATSLPAMLQAGVPTAAVGGGDPRCPSRRYRKYELIGQGAQKKVYRAFDDERGIEVAWNEVAVAELSLFREREQQRVFAEIRVLKQLKHKNIMTLHDYWFDERRLMLIFITEIFPDGTLRQYRRRHKHADLPAIKRWAWQILQGLVYLHGHNPPIIHRDLKCDNIFVCGSSGVVKIGDLGLVTLCKDFSAPQSVLGTPEFMAPELYEEKYDEKVDVYAFGMCLLELATMEYPYCECKNAAQIYKKVTQGIPPASVEKLVSGELRDFVILCLCHDPRRRPEARQLLKHSFFEAIRAVPTHIVSGCGTPPKLTVVSSISISPSHAASPLRPVALTGAVSATAVALAAAIAEAVDEPSPTALSGTASSAGGAAPGAGLAAAAQTMSGSIAAAAGGGGVPAPASPLLSVRSTSIELPHAPLGAIAAAALSPQLLSPIAAAANGIFAIDRSSAAAAMAAAATGAVPMPAPTTVPGSIAAAAAAGRMSAPSSSVIGGAQLSVSPLSTGGFCSLASSLSPTARPGSISSAFAARVSGSGATSPGIPPGAIAVGGGGGLALSRRSGSGGGAAAASGSGPNSPASALTAALQLSPSPSPGCGSVGGGSSASPGSRQAMSDIPAAAGDANAYGRCGAGAWSGNGYSARTAEGRSQQPGGPYAGVSVSAAAIAAAAVSAAAAAVGASSGPSIASPLGLPAIHEDHELQEDMMFDQDDNGRRSALYDAEDGSDEEDEDGVRGEDDGCGSEANSPAGAAAPAGAGAGGRSQPVSLKARSSGQEALSNMALSFAMSFTNQRGVRKKVGFQYDMLHDTASAIAVEMVENLSLNQREAEAIAAMIQHEVSRFNQQQQPEQQQQPQQPE